MKLKRIISVILLLSVTALTLFVISCGNDENANPARESNDSGDVNIPSDNNAENGEDKQKQRPALDLPDVTFNGYAFRVLNVPQSEVTWVYTTIWA